MDNNPPKLTGLNAITSTLNRGSHGDQVKALQQYLNGLGYDVGKIDSTYGPKVEAAVKQFQIDNGLQGDGSFGPLSRGKALTVASTSNPAGEVGSGRTADDPRNMFNTETGQINPHFKPTTQEELDSYYRASALAHPVFQGNSADDLAYAADTGDFSRLYDTNGQPFTAEQQAAALSDAKSALAPGFDAAKQKETQDVEGDIEAKRLSYDNQNRIDQNNFEKDKQTLDQNAADNGVLFSGARYEKEKKLSGLYNANQEYNNATTGNGIAKLARGYQSKYGNDAANSPILSQYYQVGGNNYNANVTRGGTTPRTLSSVYDPNSSNFQGTEVVKNNANANIRAANLLKNKGNKLLTTGYNNQL